ncbi:MAG: flavodoxin family protein [Deltaproteobacteria bacterium]|nr:flavodoxin family protein [Deltaproteobacteria bacterium]
MDILYLSGSPRKKSNTDYLLMQMLSETAGEFIKISDYWIEPCGSCWKCLKLGRCIIDDDMSNELMPRLLKADALILGSPVYFNNVSSQMKAFIDRTWCLKGKLRNKIGGAVVVGRNDGAEGAITAIHAFFLKHDMIPANRGVHGYAYATQEIEEDPEAMESAKKLSARILELGKIIETGSVPATRKQYISGKEC